MRTCVLPRARQSHAVRSEGLGQERMPVAPLQSTHGCARGPFRFRALPLREQHTRPRIIHLRHTPLILQPRKNPPRPHYVLMRLRKPANG